LAPTRFRGWWKDWHAARTLTHGRFQEKLPWFRTSVARWL
jgi:hypothetical protein